ncbi:MAG TPA: FkbM family methyltransferase [Opitutaceae bacterium]|nr:FkbM family methyltransferase [Opitutaceae bacterium]
MNLLRSSRAFRDVCREDAAFRNLGRPFGWSVFFHYMGRWYNRRGATMPLKRVSLSCLGQPMEFEMTDQYLGAFKGVFIDREYDCASRMSRPPRRVLDLGGNIGFGSVFLAKLFPLSQFAVVEPDPRNLRLLHRNLNRNRVSATVIDGAVGAEAGTLRLRFGSDPTCSSLEGTGMHDLEETVEVSVLTVPQIQERMGWPVIDLLKIDIEGAEEKLLSENNRWLAKVGAILIEIHPNTTVDRLNGHLAPYGFTLERLGSGREPVYFARNKR